MKAFALVLIFAVSLAASSALLSRVLPPAPIPQFTEKLAHFAAHKDDYDTLFIGSSRTFRQILPAIFDPLMAAAEQPTRSFNFGLDAMFSPEDAYVAEKIFALRPQRLRRVFIEVSGFNTDFAAQPAETRRALHWHDWHRTALLCRDILRLDKSAKAQNTSPWAKARRAFHKHQWHRALQLCGEIYPISKVSNFLDIPRSTKAWSHMRLFLARALNLGEGTRLLDPLRGIPPIEPQWVMGSASDGAVPYAAETEYAGENREGFDRDMAVLLAGNGKTIPLSSAPLQSLRETIDRVRAIGAEPILFIAPMVVTHLNSPAGQVDIPILDFSDPNRWPVLFDPKNRYDRGHLNLPGSRIFTHIFVEQVLALPEPGR